VLESYEPEGRTARDIAAHVEAAIRSGTLQPGDALPPMRRVVHRNGVASATVAAAYRILRDRGLVAGDRRRGTRVLPEAPLAGPGRVAPVEGIRDLSDGSPDPALLPDLTTRFQRLTQPTAAFQEMVNVPPLLDAAGARLRAAGVTSGPLAVVHGAMDGIERILRLNLRMGDQIAIEDPGYSSIMDIARTLNLAIVPVPVDDRGAVPDVLRERLSQHRPKALVVTPRAHNPVGAAWDPQRRDAIAEVLSSRPDLLVIEDDHAGASAGAPYLPLGCYRNRTWAVVQSVSKSLGPDLRLAVVTGSARLVDRLNANFSVGPGWVSHMIQRVVADLMADPEVDVLLDRAAATYRERREALIAALAARGIAATGRSGLNVWVRVPSEEQAVAGMLGAGFAVAAGERFRLRSAPGIRITVAALPATEAPAVASALAAAIAPANRARRG
jgi:DNA-binding transcriptional MocR family regulator